MFLYSTKSPETTLIANQTVGVYSYTPLREPKWEYPIIKSRRTTFMENPTVGVGLLLQDHLIQPLSTSNSKMRPTLTQTKHQRHFRLFGKIFQVLYEIVNWKGQIT